MWADFCLYLRFKLHAMERGTAEFRGPGDQAASLTLTSELWVFPVEHCSPKMKTASYFSSKEGLTQDQLRIVVWSLQ